MVTLEIACVLSARRCFPREEVVRVIAHPQRKKSDSDGNVSKAGAGDEVFDQVKAVSFGFIWLGLLLCSLEALSGLALKRLKTS